MQPGKSERVKVNINSRSFDTMNSLTRRSFIENTSKASFGAAVTLKLPAGSLLRQNGSGKDKMIGIQSRAGFSRDLTFQISFFSLQLKIESE